MPVDRDAAERAIGAFLKALGQNPETNPILADTPARVTEAFTQDLLSGYAVDVAGLLMAESEPLAKDGPRGPVVVRDLSLATVCPHHLLPALGRAAVAYLPGDRLVGIGTIARTVDAFARRLTLQETIGESVVRALMETARARGAHCQIELTHSCLGARGSRQAGARVITVAQAGERIPDATLLCGGRS
jgi:GTP cyclohydrolase I